MNYFAVVVDGEVAISMAFPEGLAGSFDGDKLSSVLQSSPIFVKTTEQIVEGSTYDGSTFTPPA